MIRSQQLPWLSHQTELMGLDLMRAVRRKQTVNADYRR
jgi:hypothetical protein